MLDTAPDLSPLGPLRPASGGAVAPAVLRRAVHWFALMQSGAASAADDAACLAWRRADAEHDRAWQQLQAMSLGLRSTADSCGAGPARAALAADARGRQRRRVLRAGVWLLPAACLGTLAGTAQDSIGQRYTTGAGERADLELPDGTRIRRNSRTDIEVAYTNHLRRVRLREGDIAVRPGTDARPLHIETAEGRIEASGGRFFVRRVADAGAVSTVGVMEGAVRVVCAHGESAALGAGQQCSFTRHALSLPTPLQTDGVAWLHDLLIASRRPLGDFLAELSRHRQGWISCDAAVASLRVTGTFPLANTDRILAALPDALPVQVKVRARLWVRVMAA